jgi:hypothetical protein
MPLPRSRDFSPARATCAQSPEGVDAVLAIERIGMALDRAAPPLEHRFTGFDALCDGAVDAALEERRGRAVFVIKEQGLAKAHQEVHVIARVEARDAHGAEGDARGRQIAGVGALAIALEMRPRQYHGRRIGGRRRLLRAGRRLDRAVELPLVVERPRAREFGALRAGRACQDQHEGRAER